MPNLSIEQDIIDSLIRAIRNITTANGYDINLASDAVGDVFYDYEDAVYDHYVIVLPDESGPEDRTGNRTKNVIKWSVLVGIKPTNDDKAKNDRYKFTAYIRNEIMKDNKRDDGSGNKLAAWTKIDKTPFHVAQGDKGTYYLAQINGRCGVHHLVTNYTNE